MILVLLHIVRSGENIRGIADNYQCEISDITSNNLHITDFKNLKPGMKLKIPFLSRPIMDTLEETESFIQDYYPNLKEEFKKEKVEPNEVQPDTSPIIKVEIPEVESEPIIKDIEPPLTCPVKNEEKPKMERYVNYPNTSYSGNVIPKIPSQYIKKI